MTCPRPIGTTQTLAAPPDAYMTCASLGRDVVEQQLMALSINRELGPPAKLKTFDTLSASPHGASVRDHPNSPLRNALSFQPPQNATTRFPPDLTYSRNSMLCDTVKIMELRSNSGITTKEGPWRSTVRLEKNVKTLDRASTAADPMARIIFGPSRSTSTYELSIRISPVSENKATKEAWPGGHAVQLS